MESKLEYLLSVFTQRFNYKIRCTEEQIGLPMWGRILIVGDTHEEIQQKLLKLLNSFTYEIEERFGDITTSGDTKLYMTEMKRFVKQAKKEVESGKSGFEFRAEDDTQILECDQLIYDLTL